MIMQSNKEQLPKSKGLPASKTVRTRGRGGSPVRGGVRSKAVRNTELLSNYYPAQHRGGRERPSDKLPIRVHERNSKKESREHRGTEKTSSGERNRADGAMPARPTTRHWKNLCDLHHRMHNISWDPRQETGNCVKVRVLR